MARVAPSAPAPTTPAPHAEAVAKVEMGAMPEVPKVGVPLRDRVRAKLFARVTCVGDRGRLGLAGV